MRFGQVTVSLTLSVALTAILVTAGCDGGLKYSREKLAAKCRQTFEEQVQPLLEGSCGACHLTGDFAFMVPAPDMYTAVLTWPSLVELSDPVQSRILAKGAHDGPAWTNDQYRTIRNWIQLEESLRQVEPLKPLSTVAVKVVAGANTIDLMNAGIPGTVTFTADIIDTGFYITDITVHAGAQGAHLVHPLWVAWKNDVPFTDNADSFKEVEIELNAGESGPMGLGFFPFVPVPTEDTYISMTFELAEGHQSADEPDANVTVTGGCKDVASFQANAQPQMGVCAGCHSGGNAASAMNLAQLNSNDPAQQQTTCNEVLSRVNLTAPDTSAIFNATNPSLNPMHDFSFNGDQGGFDSFKSAVSQWIAAEQAAQ